MYINRYLVKTYLPNNVFLTLLLVRLSTSSLITCSIAMRSAVTSGRAKRAACFSSKTWYFLCVAQGSLRSNAIKYSPASSFEIKAPSAAGSPRLIPYQ